MDSPRLNSLINKNEKYLEFDNEEVNDEPNVLPPTVRTPVSLPGPSIAIAVPTVSASRPTDVTKRKKLKNDQFTFNRKRKDADKDVLVVSNKKRGKCYRFKDTDRVRSGRKIFECNNCDLKAYVRNCGGTKMTVSVKRDHPHEASTLTCAEKAKLKKKLTYRSPSTRSSAITLPQLIDQIPSLSEERSSMGESRQPSPEPRAPSRVLSEEPPVNEEQPRDLNTENVKYESQTDDEIQILEGNLRTFERISHYKTSDEAFIRESCSAMAIATTPSIIDAAVAAWNRLAHVDLSTDAFPDMAKSMNFCTGYDLISFLLTGNDSNAEMVHEKLNKCLSRHYKQLGIIDGVDFSRIKFSEITQIMAARQIAPVHFVCLSKVLKCPVIIFDHTADKMKMAKQAFGQQFQTAPTIVVGSVMGAYFLYNG